MKISEEYPLTENQPIGRFKVLFVVTSESLASLTKHNLETPGLIQITHVSTGEAAISEAKQKRFDLILSDYDMSDMNGIDLHMKLQDAGVKTPFLLLTLSDHDRGVIEERYRIHDPSTHPNDEIWLIFNNLSEKIIQSIELYRTRNRLELYSSHLEELVEQRTRQLEETKRMAVIGELATMIGHDMRNPLQVITNMEYLLSMKMASMPPEEAGILEKHGILNLFSRIGMEISYLNKIVSDLHDYAREVNLKRTEINLAIFIDELTASIPVPANITIRRENSSQISTILVDPSIVRRVLENLITNAIQAMEQGGVLTVGLSERDGMVCIRVTDTGSGIPESVQPKIFEPLFTTKAKGTGFGLSVTKRLIEEHGGTIILTETSPGGTTFEVTLPKK